MANPRLPGISENEQALLYAKLNEYNRGRASFKEEGVYLVVLPRPGKPNYSLWLYSPLPEKQSILYIHDLSPDINESLRVASTMFYYSKRCLILVDYNEKRMQSNGDDLIFFGKYRGHFLHEILKIDPSYLSWIAYKFTPKIPKQERFVKIAQAYHSIHLDIMQRKSREKRSSSRYLGELGEKLTDLKLKVTRVRLEDDPYKTRVNGTTPQFFVKQILILTDASGNLAVMSIPSKNPSAVSCTLSGIEHEYRLGEIIYIESAKVSRRYESYGSKYTLAGRYALVRRGRGAAHCAAAPRCGRRACRDRHAGARDCSGGDGAGSAGPSAVPAGDACRRCGNAAPDRTVFEITGRHSAPSHWGGAFVSFPGRVIPRSEATLESREAGFGFASACQNPQPILRDCHGPLRGLAMTNLTV